MNSLREHSDICIAVTFEITAIVYLMVLRNKKKCLRIGIYILCQNGGNII